MTNKNFLIILVLGLIFAPKYAMAGCDIKIDIKNDSGSEVLLPSISTNNSAVKIDQGSWRDLSKGAQSGWLKEITLFGKGRVIIENTYTASGQYSSVLGCDKARLYKIDYQCSQFNGKFYRKTTHTTTLKRGKHVVIRLPKCQSPFDSRPKSMTFQIPLDISGLDPKITGGIVECNSGEDLTVDWKPSIQFEVMNGQAKLTAKPSAHYSDERIHRFQCDVWVYLNGTFKYGAHSGGSARPLSTSDVKSMSGDIKGTFQNFDVTFDPSAPYISKTNVMMHSPISNQSFSGK